MRKCAGEGEGGAGEQGKHIRNPALCRVIANEWVWPPVITVTETDSDSCQNLNLNHHGDPAAMAGSLLARAVTGPRPPVAAASRPGST